MTGHIPHRLDELLAALAEVGLEGRNLAFQHPDVIVDALDTGLDGVDTALPLVDIGTQRLDFCQPLLHVDLLVVVFLLLAVDVALYVLLLFLETLDLLSLSVSRFAVLVPCRLTAPRGLPLTAVAALLCPTLRLSCCVPPCALAVPVSRLSSFALLLGCGLSALSFPPLSGLSLSGGSLTRCCVSCRLLLHGRWRGFLSRFLVLGERRQ